MKMCMHVLIVNVCSNINESKRLSRRRNQENKGLNKDEMSPLSLYLVDCETGCSILFSHLNVTIDTGTALLTLILASLSCPLS